jgi:cytoskeletal protein CcmA (bactofilin family)
MNLIEPLSILVFVLACAGLMALPFIPAWREWRSPTDQAALPVPTDHSSEPSHFANQLRGKIAGLTAGDGMPSQDQVEFGDNFRDADDWGRVAAPVVVKESLSLPAPVHCVWPVFATADFRAHDGSSFSAIMSTGQIDIGSGSEITDWAHADGVLHLGKSCVGLRRLSSATAIELDAGCCFERVHAPVVRFGNRPGKIADRASHPPERAEWSELAGAQHPADMLYRFDGDCVAPAGRHYVGSLVVTGVLSVSAGTVIEGNVKARKGILLGPGARVLGSVISEAAIHFLEGAAADGPVVSETDVLLGQGSRVGKATAPSTVSACGVIVEAGAVAHGTVWAHRMGVVWGLA